jgi:hypothetical protein
MPNGRNIRKHASSEDSIFDIDDSDDADRPEDENQLADGWSATNQ